MVNQRDIEAKIEKIKALVEMRSPWKPKEVQRFIGQMGTLSHFICKAIKEVLPFFEVLK